MLFGENCWHEMNVSAHKYMLLIYTNSCVLMIYSWVPRSSCLTLIQYVHMCMCGPQNTCASVGMI